MTYPANFLRLAVTGPLHTTESFTYTLSFMRTVSGTAAPTSVPAGVRSAVETFHAAVSSSAAKIQRIKLNEIGPAGKYVSPQTVEHDYAGSPFAGTGAVSNPPQIALAVTLRTAVDRGRASSGRFFIPSPLAGVLADGTLAPAFASTVLGHVNTFLGSMHTALPGYRVCVASNVGTGTIREVDHVEVGRVLDTIRSRRAKLPEAYVAGTQLSGYSSGFSGGGGGF